MKIRVVDYVANLGGGARFSKELLLAMHEIPEVSSGRVRFEVVSHGLALERYREMLSREVPVNFVEIPPRRSWREKMSAAGVRGVGRLNRLLGRPLGVRVPREALRDCDVAWFPWLNWHSVSTSRAPWIVASLHDVILLEFPDQRQPYKVDFVRNSLKAWLASETQIAVSSQATVSSLARLLGTPTGRVSVIPLSGQHGAPPASSAPHPWGFAGREYLLFPANLSPHKNHETLLAGVGTLVERHPLVLTGNGTDLGSNGSPRGRRVRQRAEQAGMVLDRTIFGAGYVDDAEYFQILDGAWALVMPTLAEGGGSFPVWEAMERGIPAVVSDIPVLREMVERLGGEVLWFDPRSAESLGRVLAALEGDYRRYRARAQEQTKTMKPRTWGDVAADYLRLMTRAENPVLRGGVALDDPIRLVRGSSAVSGP